MIMVKGCDCDGPGAAANYVIMANDDNQKGFHSCLLRLKHGTEAK